MQGVGEACKCIQHLYYILQRPVALTMTPRGPDNKRMSQEASRSDQQAAMPGA
jgi:hypothetical protein